MPILEVQLSQGEDIISTHGELAWMHGSIQMSQTTNPGGGGGGLMRGLKRAIGGGGMFLTRYAGPGTVTFAAKVPGNIVPVDIRPGELYMVHRHGWICGTNGIVPGVGLQQFGAAARLTGPASRGPSVKNPYGLASHGWA